MLVVGPDRQIQGEEMKQLCVALSNMEDALVVMERRGVSLKDHAKRLDSVSKKLPVYHVVFGPCDQWFVTRHEVEAYVKKQEQEFGRQLRVAEGKENADENGQDGAPDSTASAENRLIIIEQHEIRTINSGLAKLAEFGFDVQALIPQDRTGIETPRYLLQRGENGIAIHDLRGLLRAVRDAGEKGLTVTRFKGLGEMNAEELRETTLDPANRTLLRVTMMDAGAADEMFRVLMGDKVEPRRDFIEKHALEVSNLDV